MYLWEAGPNGGIIATADVLSQPSTMLLPDESTPFVREPSKLEGPQNRVTVRINNLVDPILTREEVLRQPELANLSILRQPQGTNFSVDRRQSEVLERLLAERDEALINPEYSLNQLALETGFDEATMERWVRAIERKGQAIIYGPLGTGKTYLAQQLSRHIVGGADGLQDIVQFHPAYVYEDFIQGIRPQASEGGGLDYPVISGRFVEFCAKARMRQGHCVLIIDEINRANLARVFGELMYLLEYRGREIPMAGGGTLKIPENVRVIGTMNTADRSIALVDHALRRRFAFLALYPDYEVLRKYHASTGYPTDPLVGVLQALNRQIGDRHYEVGVTFFLLKNLADHIEDIWRMEIEPYLEEYFFDQPEKVAEFRWDRVGERLSP